MRPYAPVVDADTAFEARARRLYIAHTLTGERWRPLPLRWVDVMPQVVWPRLTETGRAERRLHAWIMSHPGEEAGRCAVTVTVVRVKGHEPIEKTKRYSNYYANNRTDILKRLQDRRDAALKAKRSGS